MIVLFFACQPPQPAEGTIVGNPGKLMPLVGQSENIELTQISGYLDSIAYIPQGAEEWDEEVVVKDLMLDFDLIEDELEVYVEMGEWDSIEMYFNDVFIVGSLYDEREFILDVGEQFINLQAAQQIEIQESMYLLELGQPNWIDSERMLDIDDFEEDFLDLNAQDENFYFALLEQLDDQTTLFEDEDGDGFVDEDERAQPVAVADEEQVQETLPDASEEDDDSDDDVEPVMVESRGCQESQLSLAWCPLLLGLLAIRRRRH